MLHVYHSNRLETLVDELARVTADPLLDPFRSETVVLQNQGMARWISQQLAGRNGISARLDFPLPASFLWQVLVAWLPDRSETTGYDKGTLLWRVRKLLPSLLGHPAFSSLQGYLAGDNSGVKLFQLSQRIADLFDQYLVYRPDLALGWEEGSGEDWQAMLWRALCSDGDHAHRARLLAELEVAMGRGGPRSRVLPERVSLFGLSALAPVYVRVLGKLARHLPVHLFFLNPCREYWSDLVDEPGQARRRARAQRAGLPDPTGLLDLGNPLLASLGHAGQVFLDQLLELGGVDHDRFVTPAGNCLLYQVQRDLLDLTDPRQEAPPKVVAPDDLSIQLHSTHGRLREIQVLHDRLLRLFQRLDGLEPRDVIVMAPDIDRYAPYVEAVFGAAEATMRIPWSVADRRAEAQQPVAEALKILLALPRSRFEASELLSLLEVAAVRRRFGLDDDGLERIRTWVRESGVRWGESGAMRAELGLPNEPANSWAFGLDRLFLGYALPPELDADPYANVLPYVDVEGGEVEYLGLLQSFVETLGSWRRRLAAPRNLADWRLAVGELLAAVFELDDEEEALLQRFRDGLDELVSQAETAGFDQSVSLDVLRALIEGLLGDTGGAHRFLTGRVTFCNMVPMRSIPFRVVCLIGMSGADFPRSQRPLSFDLMARHPRRGDRSRRRDDRYLFLEALLSARDVLYLSWVGNDERDNSVKVPSVVIDELLDYLRQGYRLTNGANLAEHLVVRHPLQPFSRSYFDGSDGRLFSYARAWLDAARTEVEAQIAPFAETELEAAEEELRTLDIEELIRFLRNPAQSFLIQRLGLKLPDEVEIPEDTEPFDADNLERYQLRQSLLQGLLNERDRTSILARMRGEGSLPHGAPGELLFDEQLQEAAPFVERLRWRLSEELEPIEVDLQLGGFRLQGQLRNLQPTGLVSYRFGKLKSKDRLGFWVQHLVTNLLKPEGIDLLGTYVAQDLTLSLLPVENPAELLFDLLDLRWQGLRKPLPFFPETALAWIEKGDGNAFDQAWSGEFNPARERDQVPVRIAFRGRDPIGEEFRKSAERILQPMLDYSETLKAEKDLP
jgi:exodeoxyribonuclease V gamma subunit